MAPPNGDGWSPRANGFRWHRVHPGENRVVDQSVVGGPLADEHSIDVTVPNRFVDHARTQAQDPRSLLDGDENSVFPGVSDRGRAALYLGTLLDASGAIDREVLGNRLMRLVAAIGPWGFRGFGFNPSRG